MQKVKRSMQKAEGRKQSAECSFNYYLLPTTYYLLPRRRGVTVMLVLVFMAIFGLVVGTVASYVFTQAKVGRAKHAQESAFQIAEAGLEYYRWFLAHNPNDLQNGEGAGGPYTYTVNDPEGGRLGEATLSIEGNLACGDVQSIDITSEGAADVDPQFTRTLFARYMAPSVAEYAFIINSNVWAGNDRNIVGPYYSNGGIHMDGTNNSTVTSAVEDWLCTSSFGCNPDQEQPGVFGDGPGSDLWEYPVPQINFDSIVADLGVLESTAQTSGLHFPSVGGSDQRGYHLIFQSDGTANVYEVTDTLYAWSIHIDDTSQWYQDYHYINDEDFVGNYVIPEDCALIFVEDKVWLEGVTSEKVTLVAADPDSSFDPDIILQDDIDYVSTDGSDGLTAVAENSILLGFNIPEDMSLRGIFVAQEGYYGRNLYPCWYADDEKDTLTTHGSVVSNERVATKWSYSGAGCGSGRTSGFNERTNTYDRLLALDPPPFTPSATPDEKFILWREE